MKKEIISYVKKVWVDQVWSKVIAGVILAVILSSFTALVSFSRKISFYSAWQFLTGTTVTLNLMTIIIILVVIILVFLYVMKLWPFNAKLNDSEALHKGDSIAVEEISAARAIEPPLPKTSGAYSGPVKISYLDQDPDEFRFYSYKLFKKMEGEELEKNLYRFLLGQWQLTTKKNLDRKIFDIDIQKVSDGILIRRSRPISEKNEGLQMRQTALDKEKNNITYKLYRPSEAIVVGTETVTIITDDHLSGLNRDNGHIIVYKRVGLFRAVHELRD